MRIDLPTCDFKNCYYQLDGNCTSACEHSNCEYRYLIKQHKEWIPCSERLPEKRGDYLVSLVRGLVTTQLYDNGFDADRKPGHHHPKNRVMAWMPKPKPYQEGETK